jgi:hypothetical protein
MAAEGLVTVSLRKSIMEGRLMLGAGCSILDRS